MSRTMLGLVAAVAVLVVLVVVISVRRGSTSLAREGALPPPPSATGNDGPVLANFIGAEACASCHAQQYGKWRHSTHGTAGGAPSREMVIGRFDGAPIRFNDAVVTPSVSVRGEYRFTVVQSGRPARVFKVDGVIGRGHMQGGGTQGYVSRYPDGTVRFLPFDFIRKESVWFCNTGTRQGKGWVPITPDMPLAACGDWPPSRVLGDENRLVNCQGCHGSQIQTAFDSAARRYDTHFTTLQINCESCHGPGREHADRMRSGGPQTVANVGMRPLRTLGKDQSLQVCFQCHALKDQVQPGYLPGKTLSEYYALKFPILGDQPYFPDGRTRTFAYQEGHLYSDCYLNGSLTCTDCHDPHSQAYRDVNGTALAGRVDDRQCTSCHASKAEPVETHTFHAPSSPGSRCVNCHMPYLQHPELGHAVRFARSDHSIPVPRPALDGELGIRGACQSCHRDRSPAALAAEVRARWGELKPQSRAVAALVQAASIDDAERTARLVLDPDSRNPIAQFAGMVHYLEKYLAPDMPALEAATVERYKRLAESADIDLKALALASLHYARGNEGRTRDFLTTQLRGLGGDDAAVRGRWALVLGYLGDEARERGDEARAIAAYRKSLEVKSNDARTLVNLGLAYSAMRDFPAAVEQYRQSIAIDGSRPLAFVNLGIALEGQGDAVAAAEAYKRAIEVNPAEALAYFNLGNAYLRGGDAPSAIPLYQRAVELDPSIALAHFYLARSYIMSGQYDRALEQVREGLEFAPDDEAGRAMLADIEKAKTSR
jgi:tetratricopeptide (TPR) repeat protein